MFEDRIPNATNKERGNLIGPNAVAHGRRRRRHEVSSLIPTKKKEITNEYYEGSPVYEIRRTRGP